MARYAHPRIIFLLSSNLLACVHPINGFNLKDTGWVYVPGQGSADEINFKTIMQASRRKRLEHARWGNPTAVVCR